MSSKGLMGLPHYRASRVSTSLYEPIYKNLFTVQLEPPRGMGLTAQDQEVLVILEGMTKFTGLNTSKNSGSLVTQKYKFADRSFAGARPENTYIDVTTTFELNIRYVEGSDIPDNYTFKFLRRWNDLIYDPLTGRQGLKRDYVAPSMTVTMHDRKGTPYWQWILYNVFPTDPLPDPGLDYTASDILKLDGYKFRCDYWDEAML